MSAAPDIIQSHAKPFLKWAGGKRQLLPELLKHIPERFGRYYEPMVGAGALFFELFNLGRLRDDCGDNPSTLGDANEPLINCYLAVRDDTARVCAALREHEARHSKEYYYEVRGYGLWAGASWHRAARFIYLNRTGFNGLFRVNSSGGFNVPFGDYKNPRILDAEGLYLAAAALRDAALHAGDDFEITCAHAKAGDLAYFDPPYVPVSATSDFTSYTADGFGWGEQVRLRDFALALKVKGVHVILSNADLPVVRELYADFTLHAVRARRNINSKAIARGEVGELVIT